MVKDSKHNRTAGDGNQETPDMSHVGNPDVTHEKNDVNVFAIIKFVVGLAIGTLAVMGLMLGTLWALETVASRQDDPVSQMARQGEERLPEGGIRLQGAQGHRFEPEDMTYDPLLRRELNPTGEEDPANLNFQLERPQTEWEVLRDLKLKELNSYGIDSRRPGEFRVPVDRAKEMLLERGMLASRPQEQMDGQEQTMSETDRVRLSEGFDAAPTMQSAAQRSERRKQ